MENLTSINNFENFKNYMQQKIAEKFGEDYSVKLNEVNKNNGVTLTGVTILHSSSNISPTIYLNNYYEAVCDGRISVENALEDIVKTYEQNKIDKKIDISSFMNYELIKGRIVYKLINAERNKELLNQVPYIPYLDLAIVFEVLISEEKFGNATILIHNLHSKIWKVSVEDIYKEAIKNTPKLLQYEVKNMKDIISETLMNSSEYDMDTLKENLHESFPMYVLSNKNKIHGAGAILYPNLLADFSQAVNSDLIVIPSSIHETILIPTNENDDMEYIRQMICDVNNSQVEPEEILSYNPYHFNKETGKLSIV